MKFNEKLIQLRKNAGLSQEELGYKLNVTRQTISKWELEQTTPEMDKLIEIAKIFNISVDELVGEKDLSNEKPIIDDKAINEKSNNNSILKILIIVIIFLLIIYMFFRFVIFKTASNFVTNIFNGSDELKNMVFEIIDKTNSNEDNDEVEQFNKLKEDTDEEIDKRKDMLNEAFNSAVDKQKEAQNVIDEQQEKLNQMKEDSEKSKKETVEEMEKQKEEFYKLYNEVNGKISQ